MKDTKIFLIQSTYRHCFELLHIFKSNCEFLSISGFPKLFYCLDGTITSFQLLGTFCVWRRQADISRGVMLTISTHNFLGESLAFIYRVKFTFSKSSGTWILLVWTILDVWCAALWAFGEAPIYCAVFTQPLLVLTGYCIQMLKAYWLQFPGATLKKYRLW